VPWLGPENRSPGSLTIRVVSTFLILSVVCPRSAGIAFVGGSFHIATLAFAREGSRPSWPTRAASVGRCAGAGRVARGGAARIEQLADHAVSRSACSATTRAESTTVLALDPSRSGRSAWRGPTRHCAAFRVVLRPGRACRLGRGRRAQRLGRSALPLAVLLPRDPPRHQVDLCCQARRARRAGGARAGALRSAGADPARLVSPSSRSALADEHTRARAPRIPAIATASPSR